MPDATLDPSPCPAIEIEMARPGTDQTDTKAVPHICTICNGEGCEYCDSGEIAMTPDENHQENNGANRPDPKWVRGNCPECGDDLVSNMYYVGGKGYLLCWECWSSLGENPTCSYRRVL